MMADPGIVPAMTNMTITQSAYPMAWQQPLSQTPPPAPELKVWAWSVEQRPTLARRLHLRLAAAVTAGALALAAIFGPGPALVARFGAASQASVSAADTISSGSVLADQGAAARSRGVSKSTKTA